MGKPERNDDKIDAHEYFKRADSLYYTVQFLGSFGPQVVAPCHQGYVLSGACASELFLKVLAQLERDEPPLWGHDFKELIRDLEPKTQQRLKKAWKVHTAETVAAAKRNRKKLKEWRQFPLTYEDAVSRSATAFTAWRYGKSDVWKAWHLGGILGELRRTILERKPEWGSAGGDPKANFAAAEDNATDRPPGFSILNHEAAAIDPKAGRRSDPKNGRP